MPATQELEEVWAQMRAAIEKGDSAAVRRLVSQPDGRTLVMDEYDGAVWGFFFAVRRGYLEILRCLVAAGADVNMRAKEGGRPLHTAAYEGQAEAVRFLLDAGAAVDLKNLELVTPLCLASMNGHTEVVKILLAAGANVNARTCRGGSPLFLATQNGHRDVVRELLNAGAQVDIRTNENSTCLHGAAQNGDLSTLSLLLDAGASCDLEYGSGTDETPTPLIISVTGLTHDQREAWESGASSSSKDVAKRVAAATVVVRRLLAAGADPSHVVGEGDCGATALHLAAQAGPLSTYQDIVAALLEAGANPLQPDSRGRTPVDVALMAAVANKRHLPVLQMLRAAALSGQAAEPIPAGTKRCAACQRGKPAGKQFLVCARCSSALYCDALCQKAHWKEHKLTCKPAGNAS